MQSPSDNQQESGKRRAEQEQTVAGLRGLLARTVWLVFFGAAIFLVMVTGEVPLDLELGVPAPRDFRARVSFTSTDIERTEAARDRAKLREPAVFRYDPGAWEESVRSVVSWIRERNAAAIRQRLPRGFDVEGLLELLPELSTRADRIGQALTALSAQYVASPDDLESTLVEEKQTSQVRIVAPAEEPRAVPLADLVPLRGGASRFAAAVEPALEDLEDARASLCRRGLAYLLSPNVALDVERSREAAQMTARREPKRLKTSEGGSIILAEGSEVRRQHIEDLQREREQYEASSAGRVQEIQRLVGLAILLVILLTTGVMYARRHQPQLLNRRVQMLSFIFLTLVVVALGRVCVAHGITPLWVPLPLMVMIMCLVYDQKSGLAAAVFYAVLVRLACPGANFEFMVLLLGGLIAALLTSEVRTRGALIKAGLLTGLVQFLGVWGLGLLAAQGDTFVPLRFWQSPLLTQSLAALANGFLSGFIVSGGLPVIEGLFDVTTDVRLLEWSDPNQPLLQKLLLNAPGSYHHSMLVGSLAADAAEAVGANPLLARVSAYFHDAGKLKKPEYFAENLGEDARNPHEDLSPSMSSLIITAHPKDGAEMAERYGVPKPVRDIILESHGSSVLKYFWEKARSDTDEDTQMQEHDFRYRLPKPRSKEAAIVMLCDAVESTVRSLDSPSLKQLRSLVRGIIMDRLHDGQFDESGLTITDLKRLEDSLVHGVRAIFHNRVRYPGQEEAEESLEEAAGGEKNADEGGDLQQTEGR